MAIVIAGRVVKQGDTLFHVGWRTWGTVVGFDTNAAKLLLLGAGGSERTLPVSNGGMVAGTRQVYWHEPLQLDLPVQNVNKAQALIDFAVEQGMLP